MSRIVKRRVLPPRWPVIRSSRAERRASLASLGALQNSRPHACYMETKLFNIPLFLAACTFARKGPTPEREEKVGGDIAFAEKKKLRRVYHRQARSANVAPEGQSIFPDILGKPRLLHPAFLAQIKVIRACQPASSARTVGEAEEEREGKKETMIDSCCAKKRGELPRG